MPDARLIDSRDVALDEITVSGRLRPVSEAAVASIMASVEQLGTALAPVMVRRQKSKLTLIGGLHRLEAYRRLDRPVIRADIWECGADWARLAEIDENLAGADLSTLEMAVFFADRKAVYEKLHPETRQGGDRRSTAYDDQTDMMSFCSAISEKRGMSDRHARRLVNVGQQLDRAVVARLQGLPRTLGYKDLAALAECSSTEQHAVAASLSAPDAPKMRDAIRTVRGDAPVKKTPQSSRAGFTEDMMARFDRADLAHQRHFLAELIAAHADLIDDEARTAGLVLGIQPIEETT